MGAEDKGTELPRGLTRRRFLKGMGAAGAVALIAERPLARGAESETPGPSVSTPEADLSPGKIVKGEVQITLEINGAARKVAVEPRTTLLSALRDRMEPAITGPKLVCNAATCGACTMIVNGKTVYGCSMLALDAVGKKIETVEGFGTPENMSAVQNAFVEKDGMMCGFCTSGFVTAVTALLRSNPNPTLDEIKVGCHGNFCRCGTYPHVFQAAQAAAADKTRKI